MKRKAQGVYKSPRHNGWFFRDPLTKKKIRVNVRTKTEALKLKSAYVTRHEQAKILGVVPPAEDTFAEVAKQYLDYQKTHTAPKTYERCEGIVNQHLLPRFGKRKFADIRLTDLKSYMADRLKKVTAGTVHKEATTIKRMWKLAVKWQITPINVATDLEMPKLPPDRVRYLEPEQLPILLEACPPWIRPLIIFAIATGMRRGEVLRLRYRDISRDNNSAYILKSKSGKSRGVPLVETAQMALDSVWRPSAPDTDLVFGGATEDQIIEFCRLAGFSRTQTLNINYEDVNWNTCTILARRVKGRFQKTAVINPEVERAIRQVWKPVFDPKERLFFPINENKVTMAVIRAAKQAGIEDFHLHDCRHTFASWLAMNGVGLPAIAELLGHSNIRTTMKYAHVSPRHVQTAAAKIDKVFLPELKKEQPRIADGDSEN